MDQKQSGQPTFAFPDFKAPDPSLTEKLHRKHDGFLSLHKKEGGALINLASVAAGDFGPAFKTFVDHLEQDAFFSINGFFRSGYGRSKMLPGHAFAFRKTGGLRWLTACFVDLDMRVHDLGFAEGVATALRAAERGEIPPPSFLVHSGRGAWVLWLLVNDDPRYPIGGPVRAWVEAVRTYQLCQRELARRLEKAGADFSASDAARIMRMIGSRNTNAPPDAPAVSFLTMDGGKHGYTVRAISDFLGVRRARLSGDISALIEPAKTAAASRGQRARWTSALGQVYQLEALRGGFREGTRHNACWLLAETFQAMRTPADRLEAEVAKMAARCRTADGERPAPYPEAEVQAIVRGLGRAKRIRFSTIADTLDITPEESAQLRSFPPAARFKESLQVKTSTRKERQEARRSLIGALCEESGWRSPPLRTMAVALEKVGLDASLDTIARDYRALGLDPPRQMDLYLVPDTARPSTTET